MVYFLYLVTTCLGADRARIYVLDSTNAADRELRLWFQEPPDNRTGSTRLSASRCGGGTKLVGGLHEVVLATRRAVRSEDALSDSRYNREPDLREGFLARSVLCAPLLMAPRISTSQSDHNDHSKWRPPFGLLQLSIGRRVSQGDREGRSNRGDTSSRIEPSEADWQRKAFSTADEPLAEAFGEQIAGLLVGLLSAGFKPRASVASIAGGGGHVGAGPDAPAWVHTDAGGDVNHNILDVPERFSYKDGNIMGTPSLGGRGPDGVLQAPIEACAADPTMSGISWVNGFESARGGHFVAGGRVLRNDAYGGQARDTGVANRGAPDGTGRTLASSTASTATSSPLGTGVRVSVATMSGQTALLQPPSPATDCSDGGSDGQSPDRLPSQAERRSPVESVETTQARSWASAHRVLEACKEGLAVSRRTSWKGRFSSLRHISVASTQSTDNMAPAVCSLVSSLLPDCSAVLLLLDSDNGRLQVAGCCAAATSDAVDDHHCLPPRTPQPVRREDVARRALASGKALLAQASEEQQREKSAAEIMGRERGNSPSMDGARVFCIPVRGYAGATFGVLQIFLPLPPLSTSFSPFSPSDLQKRSASPASPRPVVAPPPPPSFFMATKIIVDCLGLALGWCQALDAAEVEVRESATTAAVSKEANERCRIDLEAKHQMKLRAVEETHTVRFAEAANSHARAVASLLGDKEVFATAAAEVLVQARRRRDAARVLAVWREVLKRARKTEKNAAIMDRCRRARAFTKWLRCSSMLKKEKAANRVAASWMSKRRLQRMFEIWARAVARGRYVKERRLAGAQLIVKVFRRCGPLKWRFAGWRVASQAALAEQEASALERIKDAMETRASEEVDRVEARAQVLADRVAEMSRRIRQDRVSRAAFQMWCGHARQLSWQRERLAASADWRRRRLVALALSRWRFLDFPASESATAKRSAKEDEESHLVSQNNSKKERGRGGEKARSSNLAHHPPEYADVGTMDAPPYRPTGTMAGEFTLDAPYHALL